MTAAHSLTAREVITSALGFCAANFLWQALPGNEHNWRVAFDRSWLIVFALYIAWRVRRGEKTS